MHQIHLVDETEHFGSRAVLVESTDDVRVGDNVGLELAGLDVEDEDQNGYGTKNVATRLCEVVFDEAVLTVCGQCSILA